MFVHLHNHSPFSFLDGASRIEDMVNRAVELDMPALALTDHDNMCGAVKFYQEAVKAGIKPIQGVEVTMEGGAHLVLLARGPAGYRSLCRLLTRAHLENRCCQPRVTVANLRKNSEGLLALSGCRRGLIPALILSRRYRDALKAAQAYVDIFGSQNFFLELQDTCLPGNRRLNEYLCELAERLGVETVVSNNTHYVSPRDYPVHDILTCVRTLSQVQGVNGERPLNAENYLKSYEEMSRLFWRYPRALHNTMVIADMCEPALELGGPHFPHYDLPPGVTASAYLREMTIKGALWRYGRISPALQERLDHELDIIDRLSYNDYFLVVWDLVRYARKEKIRCAGRGSAADSVVAYCLGITEVDAMERGLLFERFMSLERGEKPDIDIDFDARYRDRVAAYLYQKYGEERVASVATYNTFQARSALRDLGRALGFSEEEIGSLAKRVPPVPADRLRQIIPMLPELRESSLNNPKFELLLELCEMVAGFPRFLGTHLGGLVVSDEPLLCFTPLMQTAKGVTITQFDKDDVESLGLVKLDLLSLRAMSAIDDAVKEIKGSKICFDYERIPLDDRDTYQMIRQGDTIGVFQLESPAQRALQSRLGVSELEDIVASLALIRPGPIKGNMVEPYIARRRGKEKITYLHPDLEPILSKTYGVILFQEQVIEIARTIAGFTPGEADRLRRVMSHNRSAREMERIGEEFVAKAVARGIDRQVAATIFSQMMGYASYGFCEAHAAAFATISFKTAYLIKHYPAEFYAAVLSNQPMGYYPAGIICEEAKRREVNILPPRVEKSGVSFTVEDGNIRVSLGQIKGLSRQGVEQIIKERPFHGFEDFVLRTELRRNEIEALIKCGALDDMGHNRRRMLALLPRYIAERKDQKDGQGSLLMGEDRWLYNLPDFSESEKRALELEILGISLYTHPMAAYREQCRKQGIISTGDLKNASHGRRVKIAGFVFRPHRPPTRSGRITVFMSLLDEYGLTDITVFEEVYQRYGRIIFSPPEGPVVVEGTVCRRGQGISVIAERLGVLTSLSLK